MTHFPIPYYDVQYPVGTNIAYDLQHYKDLAKHLLNHGKTDIKKASSINLIGRGSSGMIISTIVFEELLKVYPNKRILISNIKKAGEHVHWDNRNSIDDFSGNALNIFIDDFISTGATFNSVIRAVRKYTSPHFKFNYTLVSFLHQSFYDSIENRKLSDNIIGYIKED